MKITSESLRRFAPVLVVAVFALMTQPAAADDSEMPGGPWQQTCEDASIRGGMLYARCRQDNGQYRSTSALLLSTCQSSGGNWQRTSLSPSYCNGYRAGNNNGQLVCER